MNELMNRRRLMMTIPATKKYTAEQIANRTAPSGMITLEGTSYPTYALYYRENLTQIALPNLVSVPDHFATNNGSLTRVIAQKAESFGSAALMSNSNLQCVDLLGSTARQMGSLAFSDNPKLTNLIIRMTEGVYRPNTNSLNGTATAAKPVHVYVPSEIKASYEDSGMNGNWALLLNAGAVVFHELEGSIYGDPNWWRN